MRNKEVELSARLKALAGMVTAGNRVCDVGCDHGFLPVYLVQKGICPGAVAMDLREGPLSRAKEHIAEWGLEDYIETRLSDGVEAFVPGEAETLICAGMGGRLIGKILADGGPKCRSFQELILQPQSEVPALRRFLRGERYEIAGEDLVEEDGKFYFLIRAVPAKSAERRKAPAGEDPDASARGEASLYERFGEKLLRGRHPVLLRYLQRRRRTVEEICLRLRREGGAGSAGRLAEMEEELAEIEAGLRFFEE